MQKPPGQGPSPQANGLLNPVSRAKLVLALREAVAAAAATAAALVVAEGVADAEAPGEPEVPEVARASAFSPSTPRSRYNHA